MISGNNNMFLVDTLDRRQQLSAAMDFSFYRTWSIIVCSQGKTDAINMNKL